jgi:pimeloyl-ACP methyl ester carboxylesterase
LDAVRDAKHVLDAVRHRFEPKSIVLVGHSMGGRVAAHLAGGADIGAVVALAPWWVGGDGDLIPPPTRLLVVHGTADTWTDPASGGPANAGWMRGGRASTARAITWCDGGLNGTAGLLISSPTIFSGDTHWVPFKSLASLWFQRFRGGDFVGGRR